MRDKFLTEAMELCKLDGCERPKRARGYCEACYKRLVYNRIIITKTPKTLWERIKENIKIAEVLK